MRYEDFYIEEPILTPQKEAKLRAELAAVLAENIALKNENAELKQQLALFKKAVYGQRSEKTEYITEDGGQLSLFNEAEQAENRKEREAEQPVVVPSHTRKPKRTHEELAAELPVEEVVHVAKERVCPVCGAELMPVGKEFVRDELVYVPARLFVRKHYAQVLKCVSCGTDERADARLPDVAKQRFVKAAVPTPMIPHSFCSPELLAHVAYEKYVNGMPLYRQEKDFAARGVKLSRATLANWLIYAAKEWLKPLWEARKAELLTRGVLHADETVVQVLREPGRKAKTDSRMWVYCAGELGCENSILFEYQPTRSGDHAKGFLDGYKGYLVSDGYAGYNKVPDVTRCACWAHVRRKFVEALPVEQTALPTSLAAVGVESCNRLFALERSWAKLDAKTRQVKRQEEAKPLLDGFFAWLGMVKAQSGGKLSKAVAYARDLKKPLCAFLEDGCVPVSNNRAENAIRPFVVGRKQWLFCDSVKGAEASAIFYSLAATATANGENVEQYFTELFRTHSTPNR